MDTGMVKAKNVRKKMGNEKTGKLRKKIGVVKQ
jgi:hypothetical protein